MACSAHDEGHVAHEERSEDLLVGLINCRVGLLRQTFLLDIVNHSDDCKPVPRFRMVFHRNPLSDWVLTRPDAPRDSLTDDGNTGSAIVVLLGEAAPAQQSNSHNPKIF